MYRADRDLVFALRCGFVGLLHDRLLGGRLTAPSEESMDGQRNSGGAGLPYTVLADAMVARRDNNPDEGPAIDDDDDDFDGR